MKKINAPTLGFIIAFSASVISMLIYFVFLQKDHYFLIDNPTNKPIELTINQVKYQIESNQNQKVELEKGYNTIQFKDKNGQIKDTFFNVNSQRGVINPTLNEYITFTQYYGYIPNKDSLMTSKSTTINNKIYFGDLKQENSIFISDFYFNLDEDYQKLIKNIDTLERRKKIFRKADFINFYEEKF